MATRPWEFPQEEVEALRKAEKRRLELAVQKGFWQIWVVANSDRPGAFVGVFLLWNEIEMVYCV